MAYMEKYTPEELIRKYLEGSCTEEEKALVESWHISDLSESTHIPTGEKIAAVHERMQAALSSHIQANRTIAVVRRLWARRIAAAIILVILATGGYRWFVRKPAERAIAKSTRSADIAPGHEGAILTLSDGHALMLDSLSNGTVVAQHGAKIILSGGELTYRSEAAASAGVVYNMIHTPRGREFRVVLPDGSKVWLNAASTLRYPTVFSGTERKVEVNGEAYFEIVKDASKPFTVKVNEEVSVRVLGTAFNVNAYSDEASVNTSLLSGSVRILTSRPGSQQAALLIPGQQAQINAEGPVKVVTHVDMTKVMAWKNGVFNFQDASLKEVMRQLARWYDIEIVYAAGVPAIEFEGEINRGNTLAVVLKSLERVGVHCRLEEGRKLIVLP